ncbi:MAG: hypothetical protein M9894_17160 [Planctomycetes bacterium]|nr:hypothetical protein [Planctomycetota bacterium]
MAGSGREHVLNMRLDRLERGESLTQQALKSLRAVKEKTPEIRKEIGRLRNKLQETRALKKAVLERRDAASFVGRDARLQELDNVRQLFKGINKARSKIGSFGGLLAGGSLSALGGLAGLVGGPAAAAVASVVLPIVQTVVQRAEERLQRRIEASTANTLAQLRELAFQADYARRFAEDPAFRKRQARLAWEQTVRDEGLARRGAAKSADTFEAAW